MTIDGSKITMMPKHEDLKDALDFQAHELRKFFKVGDHVKVIAGRFEGESFIYLVIFSKNLMIIFLQAILV